MVEFLSALVVIYVPVPVVLIYSVKGTGLLIFAPPTTGTTLKSPSYIEVPLINLKLEIKPSKKHAVPLRAPINIFDVSVTV